MAARNRTAIRIVGDGNATYLVDATTYDPIEWRKGGSTIRFLLYEELPATPENVALLSVAAQHATARVTHDDPPVVKRSRTYVIGPSGSTARRR